MWKSTLTKGGCLVSVFEVKKTRTGFVFALIAENGKTIGTSEVYSSKSSCLNGVESVKTNAPVASIEDQTKGESATNPKFEIYLDKAKEFRFRLKATNGNNIIASEGYASKDGCKNGIESVRKNAPVAVVKEI